MNDELDFNKLESAIGKMILACSRVEYELIRLYEKYLPEETYHKDRYFDRYKKAIKVARNSLENGDKISRKLTEMKKIAKYRHLVAHNPVHYSNETQSWHIFGLKDNKDLVEINNLEELSSKAYSLSVNLAVLLRTNV